MFAAVGMCASQDEKGDENYADDDEAKLDAAEKAAEVQIPPSLVLPRSVAEINNPAWFLLMRFPFFQWNTQFVSQLFYFILV